jgi:hypothetical protein
MKDYLNFQELEPMEDLGNWADFWGAAAKYVAAGIAAAIAISVAT